MRDKLRRVKYKLKHDYLTLSNVVLVIAVIMCFYFTYQSVVAMNRNWELTERLNAENKNLQLLTVEVETAELENEYYKSDEYQELSARKLLDKKLPGEEMVKMPENSEVAINKHKKPEEIAKEEPTREYSNFEKWMMYLFP